MSGMHEALSLNDLDREKSSVSVVENLDEERFRKINHDDAHGESDCRRHERTSSLRVIDGRTNSREQHFTEQDPRLRSRKVTGRNTAIKSKRVAGRTVLHCCCVPVSEEPLRKQRESYQEQIMRFRERADLRECLVPGMIGRISPKACEGRQRQTLIRNSRMLANLKLETCRNCRFGIRPEPA